MSLPSRCHWYVIGAVPLAATLKAGMTGGDGDRLRMLRDRRRHGSGGAARLGRRRRVGVAAATGDEAGPCRRRRGRRRTDGELSSWSSPSEAVLRGDAEHAERAALLVHLEARLVVVEADAPLRRDVVAEPRPTSGCARVLLLLPSKGAA
jgi:hypothetical protein